MLVIGATTAFFMGLLGLVNNDIKRVVAYSTLSQLGYMTVALGVSAYAGALFHLMTPGGWNRIHLIVADIAAEVARLRDAGASFRNDIVTGPGGSQILLEDPSGNVVELFQPAGT